MSLAAGIANAASVDYVDPYIQPAWVRNDNISVYDLNTPNRVVRQNYVEHENGLASPPQKRHILGIIAGNDVSRMVANPQDIESELRGTTRPLTRCPDREYQATVQGQEKLVINNRKTHMVLDIRTINLPEYQTFAYPGAFAPLPLKKETCGRPEKY